MREVFTLAVEFNDIAIPLCNFCETLHGETNHNNKWNRHPSKDSNLIYNYDRKPVWQSASTKTLRRVQIQYWVLSIILIYFFFVPVSFSVFETETVFLSLKKFVYNVIRVKPLKRYFGLKTGYTGWYIDNTSMSAIALKHVHYLMSMDVTFSLFFFLNQGRGRKSACALLSPSNKRAST